MKKSIGPTMFYRQEQDTPEKKRLCPSSLYEPDSDEETYFKKHVEPSDIVIPASPQNEGMTEIIADDTMKTTICENNTRRALFPNKDLIICDENADPAPLPACDESDQDSLPKKRLNLEKLDLEQISPKKMKIQSPLKENTFSSPKKLGGPFTTSSPLKEINSISVKSKVMGVCKRVTAKEQVPLKMCTPEPESRAPSKRTSKRSLFPGSNKGSDDNPTRLSPLEGNGKSANNQVMGAPRGATGKEQVPLKICTPEPESRAPSKRTSKRALFLGSKKGSDDNPTPLSPLQEGNAGIANNKVTGVPRGATGKEQVPPRSRLNKKTTLRTDLKKATNKKNTNDKINKNECARPETKVSRVLRREPSLSGFDDEDEIPIINFRNKHFDSDYDRKCSEILSSLNAEIKNGPKPSEKPSAKVDTARVIPTDSPQTSCSEQRSLLKNTPHQSFMKDLPIIEGVACSTVVDETQYWETPASTDLPILEGAACSTVVDENENWEIPKQSAKEKGPKPTAKTDTAKVIPTNSLQTSCSEQSSPLNNTPHQSSMNGKGETPKQPAKEKGAACSTVVGENQNWKTPEQPAKEKDLPINEGAGCSTVVGDNQNWETPEQPAKEKEVNSTPDSAKSSRYPTRTRKSLPPVYRDSNSDSEGDDYEPNFPEESSDSDASSSDEETLADYVKKHAAQKISATKPRSRSAKAPKKTTKVSQNHTTQSDDENSGEEVIQWVDGDIPLNERPCPNFDDPHELFEPIDYFQYYWDEEIFQHIADQTNLYSVQKDGKSIEVTMKEIQIFLGIWIYMGLCKLPSYEDYWNGLTRVPQVADLMPLKRYEKIRSRLHLADNSQDLKEDKLFKVRPVLTHILNKCRSLEQKENKFSIDESMTLYKGKKAGALRQYMPKKPHKWGFKFFLLCGVSGMVYDFLPYLGSDTFKGIDSSDAEKSLGVSGQIVTTLCKSIKLPRLSMVCFDNYFTSIPLLMYLHDKNGLLSTGTVRCNRTSKCPLMDDKSLMKKGRGSIDSKVLDNKIVCVKWSDNKTVTLASTMAGVGATSSVQRWSKIDNQTTRIDVPCPDIVRNYNSMMGGVDTFDMLMELYRTSTRAKRWYLPLVGFLISITLVNSWLTYKRDHTALGEKMTANNSKLFRLHIFNSLVTSEKRRGRPSCNEPKAKKIIRSPVTPRPVDGERRDNTDHWPGFGEKRQRCRNCTDGFSEVICLKCNMTLCFRKNKNCFVQFHREPKL